MLDLRTLRDREGKSDDSGEVRWYDRTIVRPQLLARAFWVLKQFFPLNPTVGEE